MVRAFTATMLCLLTVSVLGTLFAGSLAQTDKPGQAKDEVQEATKKQNSGALPVAGASGSSQEDTKAVEEHNMSHEEIILAELQKDPTPENPTGKLKTGAFNKLSRQESWILINKGTERAFTGDYWNHKADGTYVCRRCNAPLYVSSSKFDSGCGWPSFDDEIPKSVTRVPDVDGHRVEIVCTNCGGHLGHVFLGERFTQKNTRHCVNSVSVKFIPKDQPLPKTIRPKDHKPSSGNAASSGRIQDAKDDSKTDAPTNENRPVKDDG